MLPPLRILAFSGSARRESLNRKFLSVGVEAAREAGCEVTLVDLGELGLPLYDGDLEQAQGLPEGARKWVALIESHQALLVASPEYNAMPTPLLKNGLDWCSRAEPNPFEGKVAAVLAASPGALGAVRSLVLTQQLLTKLGCLVVPGQCILPGAAKAFEPDGRLSNPRAHQSVKALVANLVLTAQRMNP